MTASSPSATIRRGERGFTLTELAVVLTIVVILLSSVVYTLSAQSEQRQRDESARRLESARDLLLGFAMTHGRLPCPASAASNGDELPAGGGNCTNYLNGFLPARTIGYRPMDANGFGLDAWGQRIRYALARTAVDPTVPASGSCTAPPADDAFSVRANLKMGSVGCAPANLVVCDAAQNTQPAATPTSPNPPTCGVWAAAGDARPVTNQRTVVAVIFSTGKNTGLPCAGCGDEAENLDNDGVFVWHDPRPAGALGGEYDDLVVWVPVGQLYGRLISAGVLP
jgi:prepilin-type N-terminal cleavage/methylation domain-containing protein